MFKFIKKLINKRRLTKVIDKLSTNDTVVKTQVDVIDDNTSMITGEYSNGSGYCIMFDNATYKILYQIKIPKS